MVVTQQLSKKKVNLQHIKYLSSASLKGRKVYICPKCKKQVAFKSHHCPFCGERYNFAVKVPLRLLKNVRNGIATKDLHDYVHTYLLPHLDIFDQRYLEQYFTITLVQGGAGSPARGTSNISSIILAMNSAPTTGNVLIAVIGASATSGTISVSSISQTGVAWAINNTIGNNVLFSSFNEYIDCEIWVGIVGSSPSTIVTVYLSAAANYGGVVDVCEFSGISTTADQTAVNNGTATTSDTGTTATTTQANELWIGGICCLTSAQTSPTNGFTLLDGVYYNTQSTAFLYKIVSSIGTANSGTSTSSADYVGCIATFKASARAPQVYGDGITSYIC